MKTQMQPKALDVIELDIEGLYEDTFCEAFQFGGYDEFQMRAEIDAIRERRKAGNYKRQREHQA